MFWIFSLADAEAQESDVIWPAAIQDLIGRQEIREAQVAAAFWFKGARLCADDDWLGRCGQSSRRMSEACEMGSRFANNIGTARDGVCNPFSVDRLHRYGSELDCRTLPETSPMSGFSR
jgi:hypothetical protein